MKATRLRGDIPGIRNILKEDRITPHIRRFIFIAWYKGKCGGVETLEKVTLNITFHNPNTAEEVVKELIKVSAEVAKVRISELLHIEASRDAKEQNLSTARERIE